MSLILRNLNFLSADLGMNMAIALPFPNFSSYVFFMRKTILDIQSRKKAGSDAIVCLTSYTAPMASALDPHCDILLVGDSVAMVLYGHPSTLQADMDMMIRHGQAVVRSTENAMVIVDMPFGSYQESKEVAYRNAATILRETGATAVKIEGGIEMAETVQYLAERGVPVMGHVGLQPQSVHTMGGFKTQGRDDDGARKIIADAKAIADAGAFTIVLEGVLETLAREVTEAVDCPVIGIGASSACDGQILVSEDMLGFTTGKKPKFVKEYAHVAEAIAAAVGQYAQEVRSRAFPNKDYVYAAKQPAAVVPSPILSTSEAALPSVDETVKANDDGEEIITAPFILRATPRSTRD